MTFLDIRECCFPTITTCMDAHAHLQVLSCRISSPCCSPPVSSRPTSNAHKVLPPAHSDLVPDIPTQLAASRLNQVQLTLLSSTPIWNTSAVPHLLSLAPLDTNLQPLIIPDPLSNLDVDLVVVQRANDNDVVRVRKPLMLTLKLSVADDPARSPWAGPLHHCATSCTAQPVLSFPLPSHPFRNSFQNKLPELWPILPKIFNLVKSFSE